MGEEKAVKGEIMSYPKVSIIIPNWNGKDVLGKCLDSISVVDYSRYNVIVVDNGSTDGSVKLIKQKFPWVILIENERNLGFAKAVNIGIKKALTMEAEYILLLNNDIEAINKKWLKEMIGVAEPDPEIGIVGCRLLPPDKKILHMDRSRIMRIFDITYDERKELTAIDDKRREVDYVTGAVFLIKKEVIEKIGMFDEGFTPAYFEETDYCARARKVGYKIVLDPKIMLIHHVGTSTKKQGLDWIYFTFQKNKIRFILLNSSLRRLPAVFANFFYDIVSVFFEKERKHAPLLTKGNLNIKLRKNWRNRLDLYTKAIAVNLVDLKNILKKRKKRLKSSTSIILP